MPAPLVMMIVILFVIGAAVAFGVVCAMAMALLRPPRMSDGKAVWVMKRLSPGDLGLRYEETAFDIRDERDGKPLRIAGWWIPHAAAEGRCVVFLHGYADAKVGSIAWAPLWHSMGFNILAIDLRAHGYSGGIHCTAGYWERRDVSQVLNQLRAARPEEARQLILFGVSLGAATAVATAAMRDDLSAVVLESPPSDFRVAAMLHMDLIGAPGRPFQSMAIALAERWGACNFAAVRPVDLIREVTCPILLVAPDSDPIVSEGDRAAMEQALTERRRSQDQHWNVNAGHLRALEADPTQYEERLRGFLQSIQLAPAQAVSV